MQPTVTRFLSWQLLSSKHWINSARWRNLEHIGLISMVSRAFMLTKSSNNSSHFLLANFTICFMRFTFYFSKPRFEHWILFPCFPVYLLKVFPTGTLTDLSVKIVFKKWLYGLKVWLAYLPFFSGGFVFSLQSSSLFKSEELSVKGLNSSNAFWTQAQQAKNSFSLVFQNFCAIMQL